MFLVIFRGMLVNRDDKSFFLLSIKFHFFLVLHTRCNILVSYMANIYNIAFSFSTVNFYVYIRTSGL